MACERLPCFFGGFIVKTAAFGLIAILLVTAGCGGPKPEPVLDVAQEGRIWLPEREPYRMAVGDELSVTFFYYSHYNVNITVRPDGMVTVPLVGELMAEGRRPKELEDVIRVRYAEVLAEPEVSVIVRDFAGQSVFVFGEVGNPGVMPLKGNMTMVDAIAQAGGVARTGRKDSIVLMRKTGAGGFTGTRVDFEEILKSDSGENIYLKPSDVIYVPMSTIAKVDLFVEQFFKELNPAWQFYIHGRESVNPEGEYIIGN